MANSPNNIEKIVYDLALKANIHLRADSLSLIKKAYTQETSPAPRNALGVIIDNANIAKKRKMAICQDTGLPLVFVEVSRKRKIDYNFEESIQRGLVRAYNEGGFRASTVKPFESKPCFSPKIIHFEFTNRPFTKITVFPKGFGSENKSKLKMFNPTVSRDKITEFVVEAVREAGPSACPPYFVGVGIGGTSDLALLLAKKAFLSRLDKPDTSSFLAKWEEEIYQKLNRLRIGPMGLGGKFTVLSVKIKMHPTHIAGLPVGVNISCHALRSAQAVIRDDK